MKKLTKQEQKDEAWEAYLAIVVPAWKAYDEIDVPARKAYVAKCKEIDQQGEK